MVESVLRAVDDGAIGEERGNARFHGAQHVGLTLNIQEGGLLTGERGVGQVFGGKGVSRAVANVNGEIAAALQGIMADDQFLLDQKLIDLDGTPNKERLGANAILAVSLACAHAAAAERAVPLYRHINDIAGRPEMSVPVPMFNVLNGGVHASHSADFQEFLLIPKRAGSYAQAVQVAAEIFMALKRSLAGRGLSTAVGDEGGFALPVKANTDMLDLLQDAAQTAGYTPGTDVGFGIDIAASELLQNNRYVLHNEGWTLDASGLIGYLADIAKRYPLLSLEDGLAEDAWTDWTQLTERLSGLQLVGDDLLVTNRERLQRAIDQKAGNAILIKPNQIGTLTETIRTIQLAKEHGWRTIVSHRSGETEDVTITHLAVGTGAGQIKTGSLSRTERTAKHNELMRIEAADLGLQLARPFAA
ncbi:MAG TPA: phosphopyruvate hydratase [Candidatus Saccharimonadales bacterium]|nr:phosphopyruvate hydratase [Candidatus Saccharimonadales bacterium]